MSDELGLTSDQLREIGPILSEHLARMSELTGTCTNSGQPPCTEDFDVAYRELAVHLQQRLANRLSDRQVLRLLEILQDVEGSI